MTCMMWLLVPEGGPLISYGMSVHSTVTEYWNISSGAQKLKKIYREGLCLSAHASASLRKSSVCLVTLTPLAFFLWREGKQDFIEESDSASCGREGSAEWAAL